MKRAALAISELALWVVAAAILTGCRAEMRETPAATPASNETKTETTAAKPAGETKTNNSMTAKLIPREVLFGNPQKSQARLSPDGKYLSYAAPVDGVMNVWVGPADDITKAKPVTEEKVRPIRGYNWAYDSKHVLYSQDTNGNENFHLFATNVETGKTKDLTPIDGVRAELQGASEKFPNEILVGLNDRDKQLHDVWRINIDTGEKKLVQENPGVAGYLTDDDFNVRIALNYTPTGGQVWLMPEGEGDKKEWKEFIEFGPEDAMTSGPAGFDKSNRTLYYQDSRNRDTAGLFGLNLDDNKVTLIAEDPRADAGGVISHPTEKTIQAVSFEYAKNEWKFLDDTIKADFDFLGKVQDGEIIIADRTQDDTKWIVAFLQDDGPVKTYLYERTPGDATKGKTTFLFQNRDDLDDYELVKMHTPIIKSRDGLNLVSYLSLPPGSDPDGDGVPDKPVPMLLYVHGGPWARDSWGLNPYHQWMANRGYAVLSVNYRGSTGFGKNFINAANGEWSGKMHDDLIDAVNWAVEQKIADKDKVAIGGGSYGGYATLVGMTYTPDVFAAGVDIVGPSSLVTLLQNIPPYWAPFMPVMKVRVGDVDTEEGRAALLKRSPLELVDKIEKPLLIGQGANDPRVTQLEADQIVKAMQEHKIPVTYVLYPDEGHGFARPENRMSFNAVMEAFLAEQLGGRYEAVGKDFKGATIRVPAGADDVPGISDALEEVKQDSTKAAEKPST